MMVLLLRRLRKRQRLVVATIIDKMTEMGCHRHCRRQVVVTTTRATAVAIVVVRNADGPKLVAREIFVAIKIIYYRF